MKKKSLIKMIVFVAVGAIGGFSYYYFVGCKSGSCPITGNPYISTAYGALFGVILGWDARLFKKRSNNTPEEEK